MTTNNPSSTKLLIHPPESTPGKPDGWIGWLLALDGGKASLDPYGCYLSLKCYREVRGYLDPGAKF